MNKFNLVYMNEAEAAEGGQGSGAVAPQDGGNWYDSLPEDIRSDQNITKFDSTEALAKSYINAQQLIGRDKIPMPVTDEDWSNVYNRLGRPEDVTGYKIDAPEGVEINQDAQNSFLEMAHKAGFNQNQVEMLAQWEFARSQEAQNASQQSSEQAFNDAINGLKNEWGNAFEQNANIAVRAAGEFLNDADRDFLANAKIDGVNVGDHPAFLKMFHKIGTQMMEGKQLEGLGSEQAKTPQEIEDERSSLMNNPAYVDRNHPEHAKVLRQVQELFKLQYGG